MKAFIYTGGRICAENITEHPKADDLVIAADSGYKNALELGEQVEILLGDFDSLGEKNIPKKVEVVKVPAEKDFTDTQLAVQYAADKGASEIVIVGGLDGRLDHTLSNIAILRDLAEKNIYATMTNGYNRIRYLKASSTLIARSGFRYLSVLSDGEKVKGVSVEGCKYPLKNATLTNKYQYAVSNEIVGNCALVSVRKGAIYIIESKDL